LESLLRVLSEDEKTQVHERSLKILAETGVRVDTAKGRQHLKDAGAEVDDIGADIYGENAERAVSLALEFMSKKQKS